MRKSERRSRRDQKRDELCSHMRGLVKWAESQNLSIAGPGDLGGAWLICGECMDGEGNPKTVCDVQDAFE